MKIGKTVRTVLAAGVVIVTLGACQKPEGPAERAGKEVDKATAKAGAEIEKAGEKIQDAAKK